MRSARAQVTCACDATFRVDDMEITEITEEKKTWPSGSKKTIADHGR
jgi:hypothetical protein